MWRFTKNTGITEGFHTKLEMISRRAYGFKDFENYRLRVRVWLVTVLAPVPGEEPSRAEEPTHVATARTPLAGVLGFEPRQADPESAVLPLHYTPLKGRSGSGTRSYSRHAPPKIQHKMDPEAR